MDDELREIRERKMEELRKRFDPPAPSGMKSHAGIITITNDNFLSVVADHPRLVIDFWAPWCGPCRMLAPVIEELAAEFAGKVSFGKCNTDENQNIANRFGINAIPTVFFFLNGQAVHQVAGVLPRPQLAGMIQQIFSVTG
jgi:thioredoxin 1